MSTPRPSWPINYAEDAPAKPNQLWNVLGRGEGGLRGKRALLENKEPPPPLIPRVNAKAAGVDASSASKPAAGQGQQDPKKQGQERSSSPKLQTENDLEFIPLGNTDETEASDTNASLPLDAVDTERPIWARTGAYHDTFHLALHQEILDFVRYVTPTEAERGVRAALLERLRGVTGRVFPAADTQVFGSYATDLYLPTSDIDVCVMGSGESQRDALRRLGSALRQHGFERVQCIDNAKVPIVKCVDSSSGISVDVSFDVSNGPENVALIKDYLRRYPALRPLVLVLKCFLLQRKLNEVFSGGIGSYCLILVVMSHLQMYGSNFRRSPDQRPSLGTLLLDLLQLYGKLFNYTNVGLAPRGRGAYFSKEEHGWKQQNRPHLLSVEDPQDSDNDVAKSSFNIFAVRRAFAYGHSLLTAKERAHEADNSSTGSTALGALISFTRPNQAEVGRAESSEDNGEPSRKRAR